MQKFRNQDNQNLYLYMIGFPMDSIHHNKNLSLCLYPILIANFMFIFTLDFIKCRLSHFKINHLQVNISSFINTLPHIIIFPARYLVYTIHQNEQHRKTLKFVRSTLDRRVLHPTPLVTIPAHSHGIKKPAV